jgi:hypothetical protein
VGYVRPKAFHVLSLGGDLAGLTIRVRHRTGEDLKALGMLMAGDTPPSADSSWQLLPLFLGALHWWDLETEDGGMVPPTYEALMGYDDQFIRDVLTAYWQALDLPYPTGQAWREVDQATAHRGEDWVSSQVTADRTIPDGPGQPRIDPDAADAHDMDIPPTIGPSLEELERFVTDAGPAVPVPA